MSVVFALSVALFVGLAAPLSYILWFGLRDDIREADVMVVLGNHVHSDGRPSPRLAARLDRAIELYRSGLFPKVLVSGGVSSSGADETSTMAAYLRTSGIPEAVIVIDPDGVNTAATARNAASWMRSNDVRTVLAVSQYFHIARIRMAFRQNGIVDFAHAHAPYWGWRDPYLLMREIAALIKYSSRGG
ncbi:MAG: YdcF family protein [Pseudomonadota bacterium]